MNLRKVTTIVSSALLVAGLGLQQAGAQTYLSSVVSYGLTGTGFSASDAVGGDPLQGISLSGTAGSATGALGLITDPLSGITLSGGPLAGTVTNGSGVLTISAGVASFTLTSGIYTPTVPGNTITDFGFTFDPSTIGFVGGGTTTVVGGVSVTTGDLVDFTGSASVTDLELFNPTPPGGGPPTGTPPPPGFPPSFVPEPGMVSLLGGLAVVGSGLGLRRRRRSV